MAPRPLASGGPQVAAAPPYGRELADSGSKDCHDPLPLKPPPGSVDLVARVIRKFHDDRRIRVLLPQSQLQPQIGDPAACYLLHVSGLLASKPCAGVVIFVATPIKLQHHAASAFTACPTPCGPPIAIKVVKRTRSHPDDPLAEIATLRLLLQVQEQQQCYHPNLIRLLDCLEDEDFFYLVYPYISGGDLLSLVKSYGGIGVPEPQVVGHFRQVVEGLLFMKRHARLAHHDISLENILLSDSGDRVTIIDLGMCLRVPEPKGRQEVAGRGGCQPKPVYLTPQPRMGKRHYVSPEVIREIPCDPFAADIWSLGCLLYMMLTGRPLYQSPMDKAFYIMTNEWAGAKRVVTVYEAYGLQLSSHAKDLVCAMLRANPLERPTLEQVLQHPFLR